MGGKASVLLIMGFSIIFLMMGNSLNSVTVSAVDNLSNYYEKTVAHNIAITGANIAANRIFLDGTWTAGMNSIDLYGGELNVSVDIIDAVKDIRRITATGSYQGITKEVKVTLQPSKFSKFGNFYKNMTALPATGDTFSGPFHVNAQLKTWGTPVFWGKATCKNGLKMYGNPKDPKFYGGFDSGIDIPLEFDTSGLRADAASDGYIFQDTTFTGQQCDVRLYFNSDGTVEHSFKIGAGDWSTPDTTALTTLAPNGIIYVGKGNIYTKGTLSGRVTIVAIKNGLAGTGEVWQVDDLKYEDDPTANLNSTDMLGIVAEENIRLQFNDSTMAQDIITQGSLFSLNGDIGPDNDLINHNSLNSWRILGGIIANGIRVTAKYNAYGPYKGYRFIHDYDERFMISSPPSFPNTRLYEVVSWFE